MAFEKLTKRFSSVPRPSGEDEDRRSPAVTAALREVDDRAHSERTLAEAEAVASKGEEKFRALAETALDAIVSMDSRGNITFLNRAAEDMFGYSRGEAVGMPVTALAPEQFRADHREALERFVATGEAPLVGKTVEVAGRRKAGSEFPIELSLSSWTLGGEAHLTALLRDITDRKEAERASQMLASVVESSGDAIWTKTVEGVITSWNPAAERMFGYSASEAIGRPVGTLMIPEHLTAEEPELRSRVLAGEQIEPFETELVRKDGRVLKVSLTHSPMVDKEGKIVGMAMIARDITDRKDVEERLRRTAAIVGASEDAIVAATTEGVIASWNPGAERLLGYSADEMVGQPVKGLVPEHRRGEEAKIFEALRAGKTTSSHETERLRKDGSLAEVSLTVSPVKDAAGSVVGAAAILRDTSERRRAEEAARRAEERFRGAFDNAPIGMALVASDGRFSQVNRSLCEITGYPEQELLSRTLRGITHPDEGGVELEELLGGGLRTHKTEMRLLRADGRVVWGLLGVSRIDGSGDRSANLIVQIEDITERKRAEDRLIYLADHDALTGLYNRGRWELELSRQIAYADRYGNGLAVLLLDLDNLKGVNDALGHEAGDDLLKKVARALDERLRKTDMVGRLGGDEFAVLLPHAGPGRSQRVAGTLLRAVRDAATPGDEDSVHSSVSIGVAFGDEPDGEGPGLLARADLALYEAKAAGGDRIAVYEHGRTAVGD